MNNYHLIHDLFLTMKSGPKGAWFALYSNAFDFWNYCWGLDGDCMWC